MRRVVITGMGINSCLGNDLDTVSSALREGRPGIVALPDHAEAGLRSQIGGRVDIDLDAQIDRKLKRFMSDAAAYSYIALRDAIADAGLDEAQVSNVRTGLIAGSGGGSSQWQVEAADLLRNRGVRKVGPYMVPRTMCSTVSANLATAFSIKGLSYSLSAACATSAHCIGAAADLIRHGAQDIVFAGGGEDLHWSMSVMFDAMGALSTGFNDTPAQASRPYDANRDGFVIAGGAGMLVLEDYDHAVARGARIHAELIGYGVTSDGADMVAPSGEGRLPQHPRHVDATGRHHRAGCGAGGVRRQAAADLLDQGAVGPLAGRRERARGDFLPADDARRFHGRLGEHRDAGRACRRLPDPAAVAGSEAGYGDVQQLRLWRHERDAGVRPGVTFALERWGLKQRRLLAPLSYVRGRGSSGLSSCAPMLTLHLPGACSGPMAMPAGAGCRPGAFPCPQGAAYTVAALSCRDETPT